MSCFHLALPANDLEETKAFYEDHGFSFGRESDQFLIMNFFDHQVVFHKSDQIQGLKMYPRHYGMIIDDEETFEQMYSEIENPWQEMFHRYEGKPEEHKTFFIADPSNNLIEFKWYKNPEMVFGK